MTLAALVVCSLAMTLFTQCTKDKVNNLEEQIIGKWMKADINGQPAPTNEKVIFTFVSLTEAYRSGSFTQLPDDATVWNDRFNMNVVIDGNKMTLTGIVDEHTTNVAEFTVSSISATEFTAKLHVTAKVDGNVVFSMEETDRFVKVTDDYTQAILGTWEGHVTRYNADGTYVYYNKDGNNWIPNPLNTLNEYFVDGKLLCMRWINNGAEYREWWEIASIEDNVMSWTALRKKDDGTTYTASFSMTKVNN